jgi:Cyclic nucleotide-binding domain
VVATSLTANSRIRKAKQERQASMNGVSSEDGTGIPEFPVCDPEVVEDLLAGHNLICHVFFQSPVQTSRNAPIIKPGEPTPPIFLVRNGYAVRSCTTATGRRSIVDVFVPGDVCGSEHAFTKHPSDEIRSVGLTLSRCHGIYVPWPLLTASCRTADNGDCRRG